MDKSRIQELLQTTVFGRVLDVRDSIDSTQLEAVRQIEAGTAEHGLVVAASYQTGGIGQQGRKWSSGRENVLFTLVLRAAKFPIQFTMVPTVGLVRMLRDVYGVDGHAKWVNDGLAGNEYKKISGTLIQKMKVDRVEYVAVGIGLNVNQTSWEDGEDVWATSMALQANKRFEREAVLADLLLYIEDALARITAADNPVEAIVRHHLEFNRMIGKWVTAVLQGVSTRVKISDIVLDDTTLFGALRITTESGEEKTIIDTSGFQIDLRSVSDYP